MTKQDAIDIVRHTWSRNRVYIPPPPYWMSRRAFERELDVKVLSMIDAFRSVCECPAGVTVGDLEITAAGILKTVLRSLRPRSLWNQELSGYFLKRLTARWGRLHLCSWLPDERAVSGTDRAFLEQIGHDRMLLEAWIPVLAAESARQRTAARQKTAVILIHILRMLQERQRLRGKEPLWQPLPR